MGRSDKLVKNISFIVIGNIGSKLMGFFMLPFYTNWLSPADYGTTDLLIVYANLLLNVVACDMSDAIYIYPVGATKQKVCNYYSTGFIFQFFVFHNMHVCILGDLLFTYEKCFHR